MPEVANAERMKVDLSTWLRLNSTAAIARQHPVFMQAEPQRQRDYSA